MEARHLLILLLLPALALAQQCSIPGDCGGDSLDIDIVDSERECLDHCKAIDGCEWYSYDSSDGFCNALKNCQIDPDCATCIHGENECQLALMCFEEGECHGRYISHVDVATQEECLERCYSDDPACKYFSFFVADGVCNFFETCTLDASQTGVVSGERECYGGAERDHTKIFLQRGQRAEWIHMPSIYESGTGTNCTQPADYPLAIKGATAQPSGNPGQVVDGTIMVCGGGVNDFSGVSECFSLSAALNVWVEDSPLDEERIWPASVLLPDGTWWITGGRGESGSHHSSTSLRTEAGSTPGPELPRGRFQHCMFQLNSSHTFMAGGWDDEFLSDAYLFDWTTEVWTQLPEMPDGQDRMACTLYRNSTGEEYFLTAGGHPENYLVQSLDLHNPTAWTALPDLPTSAVQGAFVKDGEDLILVNAYSQSLLRFNESSQSFSSISGQSVPIGGDGTVVLPISNDSLGGCA